MQTLDDLCLQVISQNSLIDVSSIDDLGGTLHQFLLQNMNGELQQLLDYTVLILCHGKIFVI